MFSSLLYAPVHRSRTETVDFREYVSFLRTLLTHISSMPVPLPPKSDPTRPYIADGNAPLDAAGLKRRQTMRMPEQTSPSTRLELCVVLCVFLAPMTYPSFTDRDRWCLPALLTQSAHTNSLHARDGRQTPSASPVPAAGFIFVTVCACRGHQS